MSSRILVSITVAAECHRAFEAFTGDIGRWWKPNSLFAFTPREPGVLSFESGVGGRLIETRAGGKIFEVGKIMVWEPPLRLVFGWRQATFTSDMNTQVEVRFEALDSRTRITVTHTGWDSVPAEHVARHGMPDAVFLRRQGEVWQEGLDRMREDLL